MDQDGVVQRRSRAMSNETLAILILFAIFSGLAAHLYFFGGRIEEVRYLNERRAAGYFDGTRHIVTDPSSLWLVNPSDPSLKMLRKGCTYRFRFSSPACMKHCPDPLQMERWIRSIEFVSCPDSTR